MPSPFFCTTKLAVDPQLFPGTRPVPAWWWGHGPMSHVSQRCFHQKNPASALCPELPPRVALSNSLPLKLIQFISGATGIAIRWNNQKINKKYQMKIEWVEGWKRDMVSVFLWVGVDVWKPEVDNESCVFLDYFPNYFWNRISCWTWISWIQLNWLANELSSPSTGFTEALHYSQALCVC